jgi:enoyl-CoA hydratase/carnithine racemase
MAQVIAPDYDCWYRDGSRLAENLLWQLDIPSISIINGPGFHTEFGLLCDLTIAADNARFFEPHFLFGVVPGDGQFLVYQQLLGLKRANHIMYLREDGISAKEALDWGLVGEILPRAQLRSRAHEMAGKIMRQPRPIRRLTTEIVKQPWRRVFQSDFRMHLATEHFGGNLAPRPVHHFDRLKKPE